MVRVNQKLAAKYFGPFHISARVGQVAYRLQLPQHSRIHPVFHVPQLKKKIGNKPHQSILLEIDDFGYIAAKLVAVLGRKLGRKGNHALVYVLIQWSNGTKEDAIGNSIPILKRNFHNLISKLEDKLF